jgi:hypothetical protein
MVDEKKTIGANAKLNLEKLWFTRVKPYIWSIYFFGMTIELNLFNVHLMPVFII